MYRDPCLLRLKHASCSAFASIASPLIDPPLKERMCRVLVYIGPETPLESLLLKPENSLIEQARCEQRLECRLLLRLGRTRGELWVQRSWGPQRFAACVAATGGVTDGRNGRTFMGGKKRAKRAEARAKKLKKSLASVRAESGARRRLEKTRAKVARRKEEGRAPSLRPTLRSTGEEAREEAQPSPTPAAPNDGRSGGKVETTSNDERVPDDTLDRRPTTSRGSRTRSDRDVEHDQSAAAVSLSST